MDDTAPISPQFTIDDPHGFFAWGGGRHVEASGDALIREIYGVDGGTAPGFTSATYVWVSRSDTRGILELATMLMAAEIGPTIPVWERDRPLIPVDLKADIFKEYVMADTKHPKLDQLRQLREDKYDRGQQRSRDAAKQAKHSIKKPPSGASHGSRKR